MTFDAFHLPGIPTPAAMPWPVDLPGGRAELRAPQLTPELLSRQVDGLLAARREHLAERPVRAIVAAIDRVARRLLDPGDELRATAATAIGAVTGFSRPMVAQILDRMAMDWRAEQLWTLLESEFRDPRVLDAFARVGSSGARSRAFGPPLTVHVFSGNVPGVAVTSLIRGLLVKSAILAKTAAGEPVLPPLFARALREEDEGLGSCLAVAYWPGGDEALERSVLERADAVIAYGGREAIGALRRITPSGIPFHAYGNRLSFGIIARDALKPTDAEELAADAATAVATFDQQGCVSPHVFYVETGGEIEPRQWARLVAEALAATAEKLPRGTLTADEAAAIRQVRGEAEIAQLAGRGVELHASAGDTAWTVIYDPEPGFSLSCLNRVVRVTPVPSIDAVPGYVAPLAPVLQTVGVAGAEDRINPLAVELGRLGVSRISPISRMPWPPPTWHHDGRPPLTHLVRWCDVEE